MEVWRLQVNTGEDSIAEYCIENNVAAMGWSLKELSESERKNIKNIKTFEDYCKYADKVYKSYASVKRLKEQVKENDIIWMHSRKEGKYYFGRVKKESKWIFNSEAAEKKDAGNQLTNIDWYEASKRADEESVPGAIATAFIKGSTLQRINKDGVKEYSQLLYNKIHDPEKEQFTYEKPNLCLDKHFYMLLSPSDVEDLLALWLYAEKGYVCIPSTNKIATAKYECVLVDPDKKIKKRKHIYIQVKKGKVDLKASDYVKLAKDGNEVYLLTTEGIVEDADKYKNITALNPDKIYKFATAPEYNGVNEVIPKNIIPEHVLYWIEFLSEIEKSNKADNN